MVFRIITQFASGSPASILRVLRSYETSQKKLGAINTQRELRLSFPVPHYKLPVSSHIANVQLCPATMPEAN